MKEMQERHWNYIYRLPRWSPKSKLRRGPPWLFFTLQSEKGEGPQTLPPSPPSSSKPLPRHWKHSQLWFWEPLNYPTNSVCSRTKEEEASRSSSNVNCSSERVYFYFGFFLSLLSYQEHPPLDFPEHRHRLYLFLLRQPWSRAPKCQFCEFNCHSSTLNPLANRHSSL